MLWALYLLAAVSLAFANWLIVCWMMKGSLALGSMMLAVIISVTGFVMCRVGRLLMRFVRWTAEGARLSLV